MVLFAVTIRFCYGVVPSYGYIVLPEQSVREKVYIDSLMLIRKHYNDRILDVNNQVYMPEQSVVSGESKKAVAKRVTKLKKLGS